MGFAAGNKAPQGVMSSNQIPKENIAMEGRKIAGLALAASAAAIFTAGYMGSESHAGTEAKIACNGANACKGQSECKTANNSCQGQNACKGQGFISLTPEECKKATGRS